MIKLYGLKFSNYYGLTKALLIEKGLDFEEIAAPPTQEEDNLSRTPMGKMPSIEVDGRYLSESLAIFHYLENTHPTPAMLPDDPFEAAKALELALHTKLHVELVARRCLPEVLFKKPVSDETKDQVRAGLDQGMKAVDRLLVIDPYVAGKDFTIADLYVYYSMGLASQFANSVLGMDILEGRTQLQELLGRLAERPSIARVTAEAAG